MPTCARQMQHWAVQRDEQKGQAFYAELMSFYNLEDLLSFDETAKDRSSLRASYGWWFRGRSNAPVQTDVGHSRDERVSALCLFSHRGFEDWRFTLGTYNADVFDEAMEEMLFKPRPGGVRPLLHDFPVILMDNAKIHTAAFEQKVHAASGGRTRVMRIPPYLAPRLSPLDNGGFGLSARHVHSWSLQLATTVPHSWRHCCPPFATHPVSPRAQAGPLHVEPLGNAVAHAHDGRARLLTAPVLLA